MNKKIKGSELIKKIENNDLEMIGRKIKFTSTLVLETKVAEVIKKDTGLYLQDIKTKEMLNTGWLINSEIEILEDNTEEIEEIKEISDEYFHMLSDEAKVKWLKSHIKEDRSKINELVRTINQIRKDLNK